MKHNEEVHNLKSNIHKVSKSWAKYEMHETCFQNLKGTYHLGVE
jgi:hypothetical protein